MQCRNLATGCYHDRAAHLDGSGRCLVRGCACGGFARREAAPERGGEHGADPTGLEPAT